MITKIAVVTMITETKYFSNKNDVTTERSRLLSCLLYGTDNKNKAKSLRSGSDHYIR